MFVVLTTIQRVTYVPQNGVTGPPVGRVADALMQPLVPLQLFATAVLVALGQENGRCGLRPYRHLRHFRLEPFAAGFIAIRGDFLVLDGVVDWCFW